MCEDPVGDQSSQFDLTFKCMVESYHEPLIGQESIFPQASF